MQRLRAPVRDWEACFSSWAQGPGKTEERRCENAIRAIRRALDQSERLRPRNTGVLIQGSYRNRVNVRQESDVDVAIVCHDFFFYDLPAGYSPQLFGLNDPASYTFPQFKNEVGEALASHFGPQAVRRGNKAFDIKDNSYRVDADVAPFFDYRWYLPDGRYHQGVKMLTDAGTVLVNWPEQHYQNGLVKNEQTRKRFKRLVRILKLLALEMEGQAASATLGLPGFLIECLVYNVPSERFGYPNYVQDVRSVLAQIFNTTVTPADCSRWTEVNELKLLFAEGQKWTSQQAHAFAAEAWDYLGFEQ